MNLISHNNFLLVKPIEQKEKTASGIILMENTSATDEQIASGEVVIGSNNFKKGDVIYFNRILPDDILIQENGVESRYFALQEEDIMFSEEINENNPI